MGSNVQIPVVSTSAQCVKVPEAFHLADGLQLANLQLGNGFFPFTGSLAVGRVLRPIKELNGEVIAGTGLQVKVRDVAALLDGIVLTDKNKEQFNPTSYTNVAIPSANHTWYIVMRAPRVTGSDGQDRPDFQAGVITAELLMPSNGLVLAKVVVPPGTTQITTGMIDNTVKVYLKKMGEISGGTMSPFALAESQQDLYADVAKTNFKVDTLLGLQINDLKNGFVDVLNSDTDIDTGLSSGIVWNGTRVDVLASGPQGLGSYWKLEEGSGENIYDVLGNYSGYFDLTWGETALPAWVAGKDGFGLYFTPNPDDLNNGRAIAYGVPPVWNEDAFTISCWVKPHDVSDGSGQTLVNGGYNAFGINWPFQSMQNLAYFAMGECVSVPYTWVQDTWYHVAVVKTTVDATYYATFYVNGVQVGTPQPFTFAPEYCDCMAMAGPNFLHGSGAGQPDFTLDEVSLWSRALSAQEIATIHGNIVVSLTGSSSGILISKAHTATVAPDYAYVNWEGADDLVVSVSRDNGTTWTAVTNGVVADISGQPSGTAMRYKVALPAVSSTLESIALFWK